MCGKTIDILYLYKFNCNCQRDKGRPQGEADGNDIVIYDPVVLDAFGDSLIDGIFAVEEDVFEISLAVKPIKKGEPV